MKAKRSLTALAVIGAMVTGMGALPVAADYDPCDVNRDGTVSIQDSIYVNRYLMGHFYVSDQSIMDVNGNLIVDSGDSACILAALVDSDFEVDYGVAPASIAETETQSVEYYKWDLSLPKSDSNYFTSYTLSMTNAMPQTRVTIPGVNGIDNRKPDTNSSVVKVQVQKSDPYNATTYPTATGFIVDDHTIATAAHVVYNKKLVGSKNRVEPGKVHVYDSDLECYLTYTIQEVHIPVEYGGQSHDCDYALITVAEDLSEYGVFKLGIISEEAEEYHNIPITVSGFPDEVEDSNGNVIDNNGEQLYTGTGKLLDVWENRFFYNTDQTEGNSGGPVYVRSHYTSGTQAPVNLNTVVGIVTGRDVTTPGNEETRTNDACRITESMLQFYLNNPNIGY